MTPPREVSSAADEPLEALDEALAARARRPHTPFMRSEPEHFEVVVSLELAEAGSPLDAILRREQTLALLELLRTAALAA